MKKIFLVLIVAILAALAFTSKKNTTGKTPDKEKSAQSASPEDRVQQGFPEDFEDGKKGSYATGNVSLKTGEWNFDNALIGATDRDHKNGQQSVRIQKGGAITMQSDVEGNITNVQVKHALYSNDAAATWQLLYSTDAGNTWTKAGNTVTTSKQELDDADFKLNLHGAVRFKVQQLSGGRLNIDDINITGGKIAHTENTTATTENNATATSGKATRDDNMALGNPSGATNAESNSNNYLIVKKQYALAYNNSKGMANWVSWHLSTAWKGNAERCNCFLPDESLPASFYKVTTSAYIHTGFDRGHLCPSDDRDASAEDNAATFQMTNMSPQAPFLNQQTWEGLEAYCRTLITQGNELYIIAGGYGTGGEGSNGGSSQSIANGRINVPAHFWKIVVVLPVGANDISRITTSTRIIAVDMPNKQSVNEYHWDHYCTSVDAIERATGYDFLSNVPANIQKVIEAKVGE